MQITIEFVRPFVGSLATSEPICVGIGQQPTRKLSLARVIAQCARVSSREAKFFVVLDSFVAAAAGAPAG